MIHLADESDDRRQNIALPSYKRAKQRSIKRALQAKRLAARNNRGTIKARSPGIAAILKRLVAEQFAMPPESTLIFEPGSGLDVNIQITRLGRRELLQRRATEAVFSGTAWLTAAELCEAAKPSAANIHAYASRLIDKGRVFAVKHEGRNLFPAYAFDELWEPLPVVREILRTLKGYTPMRLASWFESTNAFLDGKRPRELLRDRPEAVLEAARDHVTGPEQG